MKASILSIGDELLIGQILNSNTQWISEKLTEVGVQVRRQLTVGDQENEIHAGLTHSLEGVQFLIIGGGLGPTHDDLTLSSLSTYFKTPQFYDEEWIKKVEEYFVSRKRVMSENNKKQAYLLTGAIRIDNDCGTAAGQHLQHNGVDIFVVPGVPHEMKSMMERYILPFIQSKTIPSGEKILKRTLLTTGLGESLLATRLQSFVEQIKKDPRFSLAFLPNNISVKLRLQMTSKNTSDTTDFKNACNQLIQLCGEDYYGDDPSTLEEMILKNLRSKNQTLALAESCTGGLLSHRLTQIPGSSETLRGCLVSYQEQIKTDELGISKEFLKKNGVVSEGTSRLMAEAIRKKWNTDYALSTTGYLGPQGGDAFATVGTVWMSVSGPKGTISRSFQYENHRERAKERASQSALDLLRRSLIDPGA